MGCGGLARNTNKKGQFVDLCLTNQRRPRIDLPPPSNEADALKMMNGTVKQVLSGDTIIVRGRAVSGPPPERTLGLANISAPRLGRKDEPEEV